MSDQVNDQATLAILERRFEDARRLAAGSAKDDTTWAGVYALLGDRERMLSVLKHLFDERNVIVVCIKDDPVYDPYRRQPAFQELIRRLHLPG